MAITGLFSIGIITECDIEITMPMTRPPWEAALFMSHHRCAYEKEWAKWVERPSPIFLDREIQTCWGWTLVEPNQWLKNWYLSLPSQVLSIISIGQVKAQCQGNVTEWDISSWWCWPGLPVRQHYKVAMSVQSQVDTHPDITLNVARMWSLNKQATWHRARQSLLPSLCIPSTWWG